MIEQTGTYTEQDYEEAVAAYSAVLAAGGDEDAAGAHLWDVWEALDEATKDKLADQLAIMEWVDEEY